MPYFVYGVSTGSTGSVKDLELFERFDAYKDARNLARELRAKGLDARTNVKVIFAEDETEAEDRLREVRDQPILKEWEK